MVLCLLRTLVGKSCNSAIEVANRIRKNNTYGSKIRVFGHIQKGGGGLLKKVQHADDVGFVPLAICCFL